MGIKGLGVSEVKGANRLLNPPARRVVYIIINIFLIYIDDLYYLIN
jgi:hypothetical protein